jgi:hypothetical protein
LFIFYFKNCYGCQTPWLLTMAGVSGLKLAIATGCKPSFEARLSKSISNCFSYI